MFIFAFADSAHSQTRPAKEMLMSICMCVYAEMEEGGIKHIKCILM